jgi:serralysin
VTIVCETSKSGQCTVLSDGTSLMGGGAVGPNPGADWHVQGTGQFNGDGRSDILWQNDNGQAAVWLMDGTTLLSGMFVGPNPGADWDLIA